MVRLCQLTIKFDTYDEQNDHSVEQHQRVMFEVTAQLRNIDQILPDEQLVQAVINPFSKVGNIER